MPARSPDGLARQSHDSTPVDGAASPTRSAVDKSTSVAPTSPLQRGSGRARTPGSTAGDRADGPQGRRHVPGIARRRSTAPGTGGLADAAGSPWPQAPPAAGSGASGASEATEQAGRPPAPDRRARRHSPARSISEHDGTAERPEGAELWREPANRPDRTRAAARVRIALDQPEVGACPPIRKTERTPPNGVRGPSSCGCCLGHGPGNRGVYF